jgi:hypothetical protein
VAIDSDIPDAKMNFRVTRDHAIAALKLYVERVCEGQAEDDIDLDVSCPAEGVVYIGAEQPPPGA